MRRSSLALARAAFLESLRLPAFGVVVIATLAGYALSPFLSMVSFRGESGSTIEDFGTSMLLVSGWVLVCLSAGTVVRREIDQRTVLLVLSKPVSRPAFLLAKFAGVLAAVGVAVLLFTLALLLAARQPSCAHSHHAHSRAVDAPVLVGGLGALLVALLGAGALNWRGGRSFSASVSLLSVLTLSVAFLLAAAFDAEWHPQPFGAGFEPLIIGAAGVSLLALSIVAAFAVTASVWIGRGGAFVLTALLLLGGLWVGSLPPLWRRLLWIVPDFRLFWTGEVFYLQEPGWSAAYLGSCAVYAAAYAAAYLAVGCLALRWKGV